MHAIWRDLFNFSLRSSRSSRDRRTSGFALAALILLAIAACRKPEVALSYRFEPGRVSSYQWKIDATTRIESASQPETHHLTLFLEAVETVLSPTPDGTKSAVRWSIRATQRVEDGTRVDPEQSELVMTIVVLPDGKVEGATLEPQSSSGLEVERLISEGYPRLPTGSLSIGDTWDASLQIGLAKTTVDLKGNGKLLGFDLARRRRLARIEIARSGHVTSVQPVEQVQLSISGTSNATTKAMVDVDAGILFSAESVSRSEFEIGAESGAQPGTRRIKVRSTIELSR